MNDFDPYAALKASLRPLRQMQNQWTGFLAVVVVFAALFGYLFVREQGRIDVNEKRIEALEKNIIRLEGKIKIDDARMKKIDVQDALHDEQIETIKKRLRRR
jgi:membrane protein implicated in regulation of membrane protease activity